MRAHSGLRARGWMLAGRIEDSGRIFWNRDCPQGSRTRSFGSQPTNVDEALQALDTLLTLQFLSFVKSYNSELPEDHLDYFYSEREWRVTNYHLFIPRDVARVVVADGYSDRLGAELPAYRRKVSIVS